MALREDEVEVDDELFERLVIGQDLSEQLLLVSVEEAQRVFRYADLLSSGEELNESEIYAFQVDLLSGENLLSYVVGLLVDS